MAHTLRPSSEKRPNPTLYPVGARIGMITAGGIAEGVIDSHDQGGWIYVTWHNNSGSSPLPSYLRSTNVFKLDDKDSLERMKGDLKRLHDSTAMLAMRHGGYYAGNRFSSQAGGCFAGIQQVLSAANSPGGKIPSHVLVPFHGDGARVSWQGLVDDKVFNQELRDHTVPWNKFTPTERSLSWCRFLVSDESPWRALVPFIVEPDPEFINTAGFIFKTDGLPAKLAYNFVMAFRYPWEMPRQFALYERLVQNDIPRPTALFLSNFVQLHAGAEDISGPYDAIYPWSCLEGATLRDAGRFIQGRPKTLQPNEPCSPNVFDLWRGAPTPDADAAFLEEAAGKTLSLFKALKYVETVIGNE